MARITPLFSSSKGNSYYIGNQKSGILVDCGASYAQIKTAMALCGYDINAVKGVFITHEHSDHIKGLKVLQKNCKVPIFASNKTLEYLISNELVYCENELYTVEKPSTVAGMEIKSFHTPHDSVESVGYSIFTEDERKISICTDLGQITEEVQNAVMGSDLCVLEANYDEKMLKDNPMYPSYLKSRIASVKGHLSNSDSAQEAKKLIEKGTTRIILGHLSQNNNRPEIALKRVLEDLGEFSINKDYILDVAPVATNGKTIIL